MPKCLLEKSGRKFEVYLVTLHDGICPAEDYLDGLDQKVRTKMLARISRFAETGRLANKDHLRSIGDGFFEFKHSRPHHRIIWFYCPVFRYRIVLTHGFKKQTNKTPNEEKKRAEEYRYLYIKEVGDGPD